MVDLPGARFNAIRQPVEQLVRHDARTFVPNALVPVTTGVATNQPAPCLLANRYTLVYVRRQVVKQLVTHS